MVAATPATPANPSNPATMAMMKNMSAHLSIPQSLRRPHLINSGCFRFSAWGEPRSPIPSSELRVWNWGTTITRPRVSEFQSFRVSEFQSFRFLVPSFWFRSSSVRRFKRSTVDRRRSTPPSTCLSHRAMPSLLSTVPPKPLENIVPQEFQHTEEPFSQADKGSAQFAKYRTGT